MKNALSDQTRSLSDFGCGAGAGATSTSACSANSNPSGQWAPSWIQTRINANALDGNGPSCVLGGISMVFIINHQVIDIHRARLEVLRLDVVHHHVAVIDAEIVLRVFRPVGTQGNGREGSGRYLINPKRKRGTKLRYCPSLTLRVSCPSLTLRVSVLRRFDEKLAPFAAERIPRSRKSRSRPLLVVAKTGADQVTEQQLQRFISLFRRAKHRTQLANASAKRIATRTPPALSALGSMDAMKRTKLTLLVRPESEEETSDITLSLTAEKHPVRALVATKTCPG